MDAALHRTRGVQFVQRQAFRRYRRRQAVHLHSGDGQRRLSALRIVSRSRLVCPILYLGFAADQSAEDLYRQALQVGLLGSHCILACSGDVGDVQALDAIAGAFDLRLPAGRVLAPMRGDGAFELYRPGAY